MRLIGKKVPERNIMGKVMMFPMTPADSTLFVTIPTSIPRETKKSGPTIKNGMIAAERPTWAWNAAVPKAYIKTNEMIEIAMYQMTLETSHSPFVSGVSDNCLKNFDFLYSDEMFTIENMGL